MPRMSFALEDGLRDDAGEEVPVEVTALDMTLVARTTSSASLEVAPGTYFVTPCVPGLDGITRRAVIDREETVVMLGAHQRYQHPEFSISFLRESIDSRGFLPSAAFLWQPSIKLFTGNLFSEIQPLKGEPVLHPQEGRGVQFRFRVPPIAGPALGQIWTLNESATNIVLPVDEETGCTIIVEPHAWPEPKFSCKLDHFQADRLLKWREAGQLSAADAMRSSPSLGIDRTIHKSPKPIAAVVTAYSIFQFGNLEQMGAWSGEVSSRFPAIADGFALRAEYLARVGEHESAAATMLRTKAIGLPIFAEGVALMMKRLDMYTLPNSPIRSKSGAELTPFREELSSFARFLDARKPFCSYPGIDPMRPSESHRLNLREVQLREEMGGIEN
jgi:hypothetical protein